MSAGRAMKASLLLLLLPLAAPFSTPPVRTKPPIAPSMAAAEPAAEPDVLRPATTSVAGATALVAGTTIGAGILALPAKTLEAGFAPSAVVLVGAWAYMAASALLIAEVNVNTLCSLERSSVSIKSMAGETIGDVGANVSSAAYAFIHYALLIAYMLEGGKLLGELVPALDASTSGVPAAALFASLGGGSLLIANERSVDQANSVLFISCIVAFLLLVGIGAPQIQPVYLAHALPGAALPAIPLMVLSFTFHNIVPTICYQLGCDLAKIRTAIIAGSAIPLLMFVSWDAVVLGAVPFDAAADAIAAGQVFDPLATLRAEGDSFGQCVRVFSLLAIATSFIGFCLGLADFYADLLNLDAGVPQASTARAAQRDAAAISATRAATSAQEDEGTYAEDVGVERPLPIKAGLYSLVLLPPLAISLYDPSLFFAALDNAGTFGILTLFGIIPAAMAWSMRYTGDESVPLVPPVVPGGKLTLGAMTGGAVLVIGLEVAEKFGLLVT